jgi:hypothetical protein
MRDYIITTFDKKEYTMPAEDALELIDAWKGSEKAFPVDLGGEAINSANIKSIEPKKYTEVDTPHNVRPQLRADNRSDDDQYKSARKKVESMREIIRKKGVRGLKKA